MFSSLHLYSSVRPANPRIHLVFIQLNTLGLQTEISCGEPAWYTVLIHAHPETLTMRGRLIRLICVLTQTHDDANNHWSLTLHSQL